MGKPIITATAAFMLVLLAAVHAFSHGVVANYSRVSAIEVTAAYDTGHAMAGGQVTIYAPDYPAKPWMQATLDERGKFSFVPDYAITGNWSVQVREAGHGAMIHIPVSKAGIEVPDPLEGREFSNLQKAVIALCVVWGSIGTALFFSSRKK